MLKSYECPPSPLSLSLTRLHPLLKGPHSANAFRAFRRLEEVTTRGGITTINHQHGPKQILWPRIKHLNITSWLKHPKNLIESLKTTAAANNHPKNPIEYLKTNLWISILNEILKLKTTFHCKNELNLIWDGRQCWRGQKKKNWYEICKLQQPKTEQYKID